MRSPPSISIVIPALNEAAGIALAVERALALEPREVIVVDGGSDDDTADIARELPVVVLETPRGRARQQNAGAERAVGEVLLFLHADTWLEPAAREQLEASLANPKVQCGAFRQRIAADRAAYRLLEAGNAWRARWLGMPYGDQGLFFRRRFFQKLGRFPDEPFLEDWLFMRRCKRRSWPVLLPGPLHVSARRWQRRGVAKQTLLNWRITVAALRGVPPSRLVELYK